ncbi:ATP-dependent zinc metalloprotease YME1L1-like [Antedon mediterranea]|uniref:ATP-dependent zinc metalloprotease YME1L1-like n=1 Tax=Antedon mediterranea TaxID=105859 RepID=UPI003AF4FACD
MFSINSLGSQQILSLSQVASTFHAIKTLTNSSSVVSKSRRKHEDAGHKKKNAICSESLDNVLLNMQELGLHLSTENIKLDSLLPSTLNPQKTWTESHVSSGSFFYNKHGFFDHQSLPKTSRGVLSRLVDLSSLQSTRGFKTRTASIGRVGSLSHEPNESSILPKWFRTKQTKDSDGLASKLSSALSAQEERISDHDSFKTGYIDGYVKGRDEPKKTDRMKTWINILILSLLIYYSFKLASMFGRVSLIGTSSVDTLNVKDVSFDDVRGVDEAKSELQDIVNYLTDPERYTSLGGKLPKGVLLVGSPGTGKTLLARAVAGEANVPFFYAAGSDFDNMFVGSGAKRVRDIFSEAKISAPCVIFIDELDSVGGKRVDSPLHPYARQTINQLLSEMDGFKQNQGIVVLAATNFPQSLDPALTRPGRFDVRVTVPKPDVKGRVDILKLYLDKVTIGSDVDAEVLARGTVGFTGADLQNLVNQAALQAARESKKCIDMNDLEFAKDKILMGPERKSATIDLKNREITAFHEGGHALVAYYTKDAKPINKATIMPRGPTLGHVSLLPEKDQWNETKSQLLAQMDICMGGRVAEELIFGPDHITTGASSDFDQATRIAQLMVTNFGMSEKMGIMTFSDDQNGTSSGNKPSPETQAMIEQEVRKLLKESYERAKQLLKTHTKEHHNLASALLKHETLTASDIAQVIQGKAIDR